MENKIMALKKLFNLLGAKKCRYYQTCKLATEDSYTCNHESDAEGYCGKRRDNEKHKEEMI